MLSKKSFLVFIYLYLASFGSLAHKSKDSREAAFTIPDSRNSFERVLGGFWSFFTEVSHIAVRRLYSEEEAPDTLTIHEDSEGLVVFIHGLNSRPQQWWSYIEPFRETFPSHTLYTPAVLERGQISLHEAAQPVIDSIRTYADTHPTNRIVIIGTSNGARIGHHVVNRLPITNNILLISIAGALRGSQTMSLANYLGISTLMGYRPVIQRELSFESPEALRLLEDSHERAEDGNTHYAYFGTASDHLLIDRTAPHFPLPRSLHVHMDEVGHSSIVHQVRDSTLSLTQAYFARGFVDAPTLSPPYPSNVVSIQRITDTGHRHTVHEAPGIVLRRPTIAAAATAFLAAFAIQMAPAGRSGF